MIVSMSLVAAQQPVDTHQFGLIQHGMTEEEVMQRLGPPAEIRQYRYPGTGRVLPMVIIFAGGRVVKKEKGLSELGGPPR